jgi:hypothetical protein
MEAGSFERVSYATAAEMAARRLSLDYVSEIETINGTWDDALP